MGISNFDRNTLPGKTRTTPTTSKTKPSF
ncbi:unnamed protein product, partial [Adineta steineri]